MTDQDYRKALETAVSELEDLLETQEEIATRVLSLRKTVNALSVLCEETGGAADWRKHASQRLRDALDSSITEDILSVVYAHAMPMTTTEISNELEKIGTLEDHKNPLATINAVLNRLKEQGKVMDIDSHGKKKWLRKITVAVSKAPPPPRSLT
jgi:hypothetical protein